MNKKLYLLLFSMIVCGCIFAGKADAQDAGNGTAPAEEQPTPAPILPDIKQPETNFMMVGLGTFGFVNEANTFSQSGVSSTSKSSALGDADRFEISPMFLWRHGSNLLVEFEPSYTGGNTLSVNWADINYYVAQGLIVKVGYFVLPVGIYGKRFAAGWINKLPSDPVGMDAPGSDFGIEAMGGFPLGNMKWSYDIAISNGFQLNPDGTYSGVGISTPNNNKTVCGRIALLPHKNSSLEIGVSALQGNLYTAQFAAPGMTPLTYSDPTLKMYAFDLSMYHTIGKVTVKIVGQYNIQSITKQTYYTDSSLSKSYSFDNTINSGFGQISVRPTGLTSKLKNVEFGYRHVLYSTPNPNSSIFGGYNGNDRQEDDFCLSYWLSWRTVVKVGYEHINVKVDDNAAIGQTGFTNQTDRLVLQVSTEF
jgi:hypothetical protein